MICRSKFIQYIIIPHFHVNGNVIIQSSKVKYLGHITCCAMSDDIDMMRQRRQLYAMGNAISRRFFMCSADVKNTLFRVFCTPLYTCQLWTNFSVRSLRKLHVTYNNAF